MGLIRQFWLLYNVDPSILKGCPKAEKIRLAFLGVITFFIAIFAIFSGGYLSYLLTEKTGLSILIGIVLGWNFLNLYRLILITFDSPSKGKSNTQIGISISYLLRVICLFLAILIIIKPCELLYFNSGIEKELKMVIASKERQMNEDWLGFIDEKIAKYQASINELGEEILIEEELLASKTDLATKHLKELANQKIKKLNTQIESLEEIIVWFELTKEDYISAFKEVASDSSYLVERFKILFFKFPESWFITLVLGGIFLFPMLTKIYAVKHFDYFKAESLADQNLILKEYTSFKAQYQKELSHSTRRDIRYYETYADPPFNTVLKEDPQVFGNDEDFKEWVSKL